MTDAAFPPPARVLFLLPTSELHGGVRVPLELADGLRRRGWQTTVAGPDPAPDWHPLESPYLRVDLQSPATLPACDVCVATFWTTVAPALASGAPRVLHLCQGFEGVHPEYASLLPQIDAAYRLPTTKLVISGHLGALLAERFGVASRLLGPSVDTELFRPPAARTWAVPRIGLVGPFSVRPKGIPAALAGLAAARRRGGVFEVWRASTEPLGDRERGALAPDRYFHRLSTAAMADFYRQLDALVFSSFDEEGFGLPVLEAMASGVAVAASDITPLRDVPATAILGFPAGDADALAELVPRLLDERVRHALTAAGLLWARSCRREEVLDRLAGALLSTTLSLRA